MDPDTQMNIALESVFYESAIADIVDDIQVMRDGGASREEQLLEISIMLMQNLPLPGQLAAFAAMSMVLLSEQRSEK